MAWCDIHAGDTVDSGGVGQKEPESTRDRTRYSKCMKMIGALKYCQILLGVE